MFVRSNIVACDKHFVGDGGTTQGIDENNTVSNYKQLVNIHIPPILMPLPKESPPLWFLIPVGMDKRCTLTVFSFLMF